MSRVHRLLLMVALALGFESIAHAAPTVTITRVSSPVHYIDNSSGTTTRGMYAAYKITNNTALPLPDVWVTAGGFPASPHVKLATNEDGVQHIGPLAAAGSRTAYFYLYAGATTTAVTENHTISVYTAGLTGVPTTAQFGLTVDTSITANANKVRATG